MLFPSAAVQGPAAMNSECLRSVFHAVCALLVKSLYLLPRKNLFPVLCALLGTSCSPNTVTDNNVLETAQRYCHKPLCEPHWPFPQKSPGSSEVLSTRREEKVLIACSLLQGIYLIMTSYKRVNCSRQSSS